MSSHPSLANTNLFKPIKVGKVELKNRLAFAPTTRYRNTDDFVATNLIRDHYEARAKNNGGLLITEATFISPQAGLYYNGPMIATKQQAKAWKKVVDAVHFQGTAIAMQFWHLGRVGDPGLLKKYGLPVLAPSVSYIDEKHVKSIKKSGNELRAFSLEQIEELKKDFIKAAKNAINIAGFDFIEIHSAHMYTLSQFIDIASNNRTDKYGGSIENRSRLTLEVVDALIEAVGADKVAIRISPYCTFQGGSGAGSKLMHPIAQYAYLYSELERRGREGNRLAYVHSVESRMAAGGDAKNGPEYSTEWVGQIWRGVLVKAGGYLHQPGYTNLINEVNSNERTLIAVSRYYTSNPDLAYRLKEGKELTEYNRNLFYSKGNFGYNTWVEFGGKSLAADTEVAKTEPIALA